MTLPGDRSGEGRVDRYRRVLADRFEPRSANVTGAVAGFLVVGILAVFVTRGRWPELTVLAEVVGATWGYRVAGRRPPGA